MAWVPGKLLEEEGSRESREEERLACGPGLAMELTGLQQRGSSDSVRRTVEKGKEMRWKTRKKKGMENMVMDQSLVFC